MQFFYVLIDGITWKLASKLVTSLYKYEKTLNRRYNKWVNDNIFDNLYDDISSKYKDVNPIISLKIDSTDVINLNCSKKHTCKSRKLNKQAIRTTIITDQNNVPINKSIEKPINHDSTLGLDLMMTTDINNKKSVFMSADKGYILDVNTKEALLKLKGFRLLTPKKNYKRKKVYKTKNYKPKIKRIRHSKQMKKELNGRIKIEHFNSTYHRSYKRLSKIYDRKLSNYNAFLNIAFSVIIIRKT